MSLPTREIVFYKAIQDHENGLLRESYVGPERFLAQLNAPLAALLAFVTLGLAAALAGLHRFGSAIVARHGWNLLEIHSRRRDTWLGRFVRLRLCGFQPR